jgi:hypothetical protein
VVGAALRWVLASSSLVGCIIPDTQLRVEGDAVNPGTVRLIQAVAVSDAATDACNAASVDLTSCPLVPETLPFGAIASAAPLCVCPGRDGNALSYFDVYVEDPDVDDDGRPQDTILGALLLDMPGDEDDPAAYVAYPNLLPGNLPAANVNLGFNSYTNAIERPEPRVRRWTLGAETGVDLCNDNASAPDRKLEPGLHSLRVVVTDRPWYRGFVYDDDGEVMLDDDGVPVRVPVERASVGVPDLPAGATYSIADYVFRCGDGDDPEATCNCVEAP